MHETDIKWLIPTGVIIVGSGVAWGILKNKVSSLMERVKKVELNDVMTSDKCKQFHDSSQAATDVKLTTIEEMLKEMKKERQKTDERVGAAMSQLAVLFDRMERGGYGKKDLDR